MDSASDLSSYRESDYSDTGSSYDGSPQRGGSSDVSRLMPRRGGGAANAHGDYRPDAYEVYDDRVVAAAAPGVTTLTAPGAALEAINERVGSALSASAALDDIDAKVGELFRRGAPSTDPKDVLERLEREAGEEEEELDSDSHYDEHDDWRRQLEQQVESGTRRAASAAATRAAAEQYLRPAPSQSPEVELASTSESVWQQPGSVAHGFLAEFRSSSREALGDGEAADAASADDYVGGGDRGLKPGSEPEPAPEPVVDHSAKRTARSGPSPAARAAPSKPARPVAAVRGSQAEVVASLQAERDEAYAELAAMKAKQEAFLNAQEKDLEAIEQRGKRQAAKVARLTQENDALQAEREELHASLDEAQAAASEALEQQSREHQRHQRVLQERLADAEGGTAERGKTQLARELERLQTELEEEKEEALAAAAQEADDVASSLSSELRSAQRTVSSLEKRLEQQTTLLSAMDEEKLRLEEEVLAAEGQRDSATRRAESMLAKLESKDSDLLSAAAEADDAVAELAATLERKEKEIDGVNERLQEAVGEADGLRHSLEEEKVSAAQAAAAAEARNNELMGLLDKQEGQLLKAAAEADGERDQLRAELRELKASLQDSQANAKSLEAQLSQASAHGSSEEAKAQRNAHEVSMLGKQLEKARADVAAAAEQQRSAAAELAECNIKREQLESEIRTRAANHSADQDTLRQLHTAMEEMQTTLAAKTIQCSAAEEAADTQRAACREMLVAGDEAVAKAATQAARCEGLEGELEAVRRQLASAEGQGERLGKEHRMLSEALAESRGVAEELKQRALAAEHAAERGAREMRQTQAEMDRLRGLLAARTDRGPDATEAVAARAGVGAAGAGGEKAAAGSGAPVPSSRYNTRGETLMGHGTDNGTATDGTVLPYGSQPQLPAAEPQPAVHDHPSYDHFGSASSAAPASKGTPTRMTGRRTSRVDPNRSSLDSGLGLLQHEADQQPDARTTKKSVAWVPGESAAPQLPEEDAEDRRYIDVRASQARADPPWADTTERSAEERFGGALHRSSAGLPQGMRVPLSELPVAGAPARSTNEAAAPFVVAGSDSTQAGAQEAQASRGRAERRGTGGEVPWFKHPVTPDEPENKAQPREAAAGESSPELLRARARVEAEEMASEMAALRQAEQQRDKALASIAARRAAADGPEEALQVRVQALDAHGTPSASPSRASRRKPVEASPQPKGGGEASEAELIASAAHSTDALPYATEEHRNPSQRSTADLEQQYMELCMKKTSLESEMSRLGRSARERRRRLQVESEVAELSKAISSKRSALRSMDLLQAH